MKRISEVVQLTGVTRRTLQEYDRIGLLKPSSKTEGGYWLYSDSDINKLNTIQIFVMAGYPRKRIKDILNDSNIDMFEELNDAKNSLIEKKRRITSMIQYIEIITATDALPRAITETFRNIDLRAINQMNSREKREQILDDLGDLQLDEYAKKMVKPLSNILYTIISIGILKDVDYRNKRVQINLKYLFGLIDDFITKYIYEEKDPYWLEDEDPIETFDILIDLFEYREIIDDICGEGSLKYAENAWKYFITNNKDKLIKEKRAGK